MKHRWLSARICVVLLFCVSISCGWNQEPFPERVPIGSVQGRVEPGDNGLAHRSPLVGETVVVRGVVHQILGWRASAGHSLYGIMLQDLPHEADGDPLTSDGLFVYAGGAPDLRTADHGNHRLRVGDILVLRGTVNERFGQTELADAVVLHAETGGDLNELLPATPILLSDDLSETQRILERHEGMRVALSPGAATVSGSFPNERNRDFLVWITPSENPILGRDDPAARRLFRGAHPLSDVPWERRLEGHGMRLALGSLALPGRSAGEEARLPPLSTGSVFPDLLVGGIHFTYGTYVLQLEEVPRHLGMPGADPATWRVPRDPDDTGTRLRIVTYNVENLYDFVNDPFSDCDFPGDPGCPGVRQPFNYLPKSDREYRARLGILARHIVGALDSPHILMLQEVENQDIGVLTPEGMVYGDVNDADGELDVLQELAVEIAALGGPVYTIAANRAGADNRGIVCAWMYQADLFEVVAAEPDHPVLGRDPATRFAGRPMRMVREVSNPKAFNWFYEGDPDEDPGLTSVFSRAVQVFGLRERQGEGRVVWMLNNHFSAIPDRRVARRRQQSLANAMIASLLRETYPESLVIVGGDLNNFPRPDDPLSPPSDQLGPLYDAGLFNVYDWILERAPATAYSYVFRGEANTLDHLFLCPNARERLRHATYAHLNADFPEGFRGESPLRGSDHDPLLVELEW